MTKIKIPNIIFSDESVQNQNRIKTESNINRSQPLLVFPFFAERPLLCIASTLKSYLKKTDPLREAETDELILTFKKPYVKCLTQSLSRWIKIVLENSGIDTKVFSAYSTRHAATSAAFRKGTNLDVIRKTGGWTESSKTFALFYNRPIVQNRETFAKNVFNIDQNDK